MNLATSLGVLAIIALGALQYTLMANAIRDLLKRPRVRGGNKVTWGLVILCLPFAGAFLYGWMGPTSFLDRPQSERRSSTPTPTVAPNVTPITRARSVRPLSSVAHPTPRVRKTGS